METSELDDDELCLVALAAREGVGPASMAALRRGARERSMPLADVMALPEAELVDGLGLSSAAAKAVRSICSPRLTGAAVLERLGELGGRVLLAHRPGYPARLLGPKAPPVLFAAGELSLLHLPSVAIVGSRRPSGAAREAACRLAEELAAGGRAVVSGGAQGIDTAAHRGALRAGGTVVVPAVGLERSRWLTMLQRADAGRWCLLGQFPPTAPWRGPYALLRNRTIVALAEAVVAFEPRDAGGTWHSSLTALRMRKPLFVVSAVTGGAKGRGLRRLVRLGAVALDVARMPDAREFERMIGDYRPPPGAGQLPLFEGPGAGGRSAT